MYLRAHPRTQARSGAAQSERFVNPQNTKRYAIVTSPVNARSHLIDNRYQP